MAGILPEAGLWFRKNTPQKAMAVHRRILNKLPEIPYSTESIINAPSFDPSLIDGTGRRYYEYHYGTLNTEGLLPCSEAQPFIRNLGNEFIAVKKQNYYLLVYVGKPGASEKDRLPNQVGPRTGGGISILWTPSYKTVIASQNWNTFSHHGIIVETDKPQYTNYDSVGFDLDVENSTLTVTGNINHTPISYIRKYKFENDRIRISTQLTSSADFTAQKCYLQIPLFVSKKAAEPNIHLSNGLLSVTDKDGKSVRLTFFPALPIQKGQMTQKRFSGQDYHIQQTKAILPQRWIKNQPYHISYVIRL
jgi:hypothetical protein